MSNSSVEYRMILERDEAVAARVRAEKDNELLRVQLKVTDDARKSERETIEKLKRHLTTRSRERDLAEERALLHERERDEAVANEAKAREAHAVSVRESDRMRDAMRQSRDAFENLRKAHTMVLDDRDNVARQRDEAFDIVTKSTSTTIETLRRELSNERAARDLWRTEAGVLREKLSGATEARDLMTRQLMHERELHADTTRDRDRFRDALRDERAKAPEAGVKRLWLVRRTDAAGKPGEYGKVIVWAADGTDAVDVVMWAGYEGNPMYGYRDRAHTTVVALEYGDGADDQVVVAETLR